MGASAGSVLTISIRRIRAGGASSPTHCMRHEASRVFAAVQQRAVRATERWRQAQDAGEWVALVTHADLVKLIIAHYLGIPLARVPPLQHG